jgi:tetratricopeptide (TPR) repeat protein
VVRWIATLLVVAATAAVWALVGRDRGPRSNPSDPRLAQAEERVLAGDLVGVAELLEPLVEEYPDTGRARLLLGWSLKEQAKWPLAVPHLERALELEPFERQQTARFLLGWCRYYSGDLSGARADLELYLELEPDDTDTHFGLGVVALDEGRLDDAEGSFRRAIDLLEGEIAAVEAMGMPSPLRADLARAQFRLGEVLVAMKRWSEAKGAFDAAKTLVPSFREAWWQLYQVLLELGEDGAAQAAFERHELLRELERGEQ